MWFIFCPPYSSSGIATTWAFPSITVTPSSHKLQPDVVRDRQAGVQGQAEEAHLFLGPWRRAQQLLQLGLHGALQLLPHYFLELGHPSVGRFLAQTWGEGGQRFIRIKGWSFNSRYELWRIFWSHFSFHLFLPGPHPPLAPPPTLDTFPGVYS